MSKLYFYIAHWSTNTNTNTFIFGNIYDMVMKRKLIIYAPGNRNYGYCRLHFGYQIMIYILYNITDRNFEINVD